MKGLITICFLLFASELAGQNPIQDSVSYYVSKTDELIRKDEARALEQLYPEVHGYLNRRGGWGDFLERLNLEADVLIKQRETTGALKLLDYLAKQYIVIYDDHVSAQVENYRLQGVALYYQKRYAEAAGFYELALSLEKSQSVPRPLLIARLLRSIGLTQYRQGKPAEALAYYHKAYGLLKKSAPDSPQLVTALTSLSNASFSLNRFDSARYFASRSLELKIRQGADERSLSITRNSLANAMRELGRYDEAESQYLGAIRGFDIALGKPNTFSAGIYNNLSQLYRLMGLNHQALVYGHNALSIYQQVSEEDNAEKAGTLENIGSYYLHSGLSDQALSSYRQALKQYQFVVDKEGERRVMLNLGAAFVGKQDYAGALSILEPMNGYLDELDRNMRLSLKNNLAETYTYLDQPDLALKAIAESEAWGYKNNSKANWRQVLKVRALLALTRTNEAQTAVTNLLRTTEKEEDSRIFFEGLMLQFDLLVMKGVPAKKQLAILYRADSILERSRIESVYENDKLSWTKQVSRLVTKGVSLCYEGYEQTGDPFFLESALAFSESAKARLLAELTNESNARSFGGVPQAIVDKERLLRSKIAHFRRKQSGEFDDSLFVYRDELLRLVQSYEADYPGYHRLKFGGKNLAIADIQAQLGQEVLISYIRTEATVYALVMTAKSASLKALGDTNEIEKQIEAYYLSLQNQEPIQRFSKAAYGLYESIVYPLLSDFGNSTSLIVLPDPGMLHLPMEALLTQKVSREDLNKGDFRSLTYLINDYDIRYNYSAAIWSGTKPKDASGNIKVDFVGFAPFSEGRPSKLTSSRTGLSKLPASGVELYEIHRMIIQKGGKADGYWSGQATVNSFRQGIGGKNIIHIASHSFPDFNTGLLARIAFRQERGSSDSTDYLYATDVYALELDAELVVLSSCESGAGRLYEGEGVFSLARSFHFAGARNIISSQWEVPDTHAKSLFVAFYQRLIGQGERSYHRALVAAKRSLIQSAKSPYYHPGYWSNFLLIGK